MSYLYELHLHTSQGSACGSSLGEEYPQIYKALGYDGIFVTDHFFQGNCAAPRTGAWDKRVDAYMRGYENAREAGEKVGLKVFFGIEQNYNGDEYLLYGVDREFLLEHKYIESYSRQELFKAVHEWGGCVIQAHPFRERGYISRMHFELEGIDGVEAVNMGNRPSEDASALKYAASNGLLTTCGSDIHSARQAEDKFVCATGLETPISSGREFARYILERRPTRLNYPEGRLDGIRPQMPYTPYEISYAQEDLQRRTLEEMIK